MDLPSRTIRLYIYSHISLNILSILKSCFNKVPDQYLLFFAIAPQNFDQEKGIEIAKN